MSPLGIYVNPALKQRLRGKDLSSAGELMDTAARELEMMRNNPDFPRGLKKCCRGIKNRAKWARARAGRTATRTLVKSWVANAKRGSEKK